MTKEDYQKIIKISDTEWQSNSDIYGVIIYLKDGYYEVYYFDECEDDVFIEKSKDASYIEQKYNFKMKDI